MYDGPLLGAGLHAVHFQDNEQAIAEIRRTLS